MLNDDFGRTLGRVKIVGKERGMEALVVGAFSGLRRDTHGPLMATRNACGGKAHTAKPALREQEGCRCCRRHCEKATVFGLNGQRDTKFTIMIHDKQVPFDLLPFQSVIHIHNRVECARSIKCAVSTIPPPVAFSSNPSLYDATR
jgi:hypothetical protein